MALTIKGTYETDQGLYVTDPFAFVHLSLGREQRAFVQFFTSEAAFSTNKAPINLVDFPSNYNFEYTANDFFETPIINTVHEDIKTVMQVSKPDAEIEVKKKVSDIDTPVDLDTTAPTIILAEITSPSKVILTPSEALDSNHIPAATAFMVPNVSFQEVIYDQGKLYLNGADPILEAGTSYTVSYGADVKNRLRDVAGNPMESFKEFPIDNKLT